MKERPILFSGAMVRALLNDTKTQTRRVITPQPSGAKPVKIWWKGGKAWDGQQFENVTPPWAEVGRDTRSVSFSRLWVRENAVIAPPNFSDDPNEGILDDQGKRRLVQYTATHPDLDAARDYKLKVLPSLFMPRWASRITLELSAVRVERLHDIGEQDAKAEGVSLTENVRGCRVYHVTHRASFASLWNSLNAKRGFGWDVNPWVWALTFRRVA